MVSLQFPSHSSSTTTSAAATSQAVKSHEEEVKIGLQGQAPATSSTSMNSSTYTSTLFPFPLLSHTQPHSATATDGATGATTGTLFKLQLARIHSRATAEAILAAFIQPFLVHEHLGKIKSSTIQFIYIYI